MLAISVFLGLSRKGFFDIVQVGFASIRGKVIDSLPFGSTAARTALMA
jgi:hypothetical protein